VRSARHLVGLPVINTCSGKKNGVVHDLLIGDDWHIRGFILSPRSRFAPCRFIAWDDATSCGEDAITTSDDSYIRLWRGLPDSVTLVEGKRKVRGMPLITVDGMQLGIVEDVYLGKHLGNTIIGFELSDGFISDLIEGRKWLTMPSDVVAGKDAVIVPDLCEDEVKAFYVE